MIPERKPGLNRGARRPVSMADVVCVGVNPAFDLTYTLDSLHNDRVNRVLEEHKMAAGKAANVACGLAERGIRTELTGIFGQDNLAEWSDLFARRCGGKVRFVPFSCEGITRQNMTLLADGQTVKINQPGCRASAEAVRRMELFVNGRSGRGRVAVFTGSLPPKIIVERYLEIIRNTAAKGYRVAVDTDRLSRDELLSVRPWLYKPNAHELAAMAGINSDDDTALIASAQELAKSGVEIVLLTLGSRGLAAVTAEKTVRVKPEPVKAVNTVGAGDAALAAFVAEFIGGGSLEQCASAAAKAGERAVTSAC